MATKAELVAAIDKLLSHPLGVQRFPREKRIAGKIYEAYVFGLCLQAVRDLDASVNLIGINGPANPFIFRGSPG